jgi:hypothetical protein
MEAKMFRSGGIAQTGFALSRATDLVPIANSSSGFHATDYSAAIVQVALSEQLAVDGHDLFDQLSPLLVVA